MSRGGENKSCKFLARPEALSSAFEALSTDREVGFDLICALFPIDIWPLAIIASIALVSASKSRKVAPPDAREKVAAFSIKRPEVPIIGALTPSSLGPAATSISAEAIARAVSSSTPWADIIWFILSLKEASFAANKPFEAAAPPAATDELEGPAPDLTRAGGAVPPPPKYKFKASFKSQPPASNHPRANSGSQFVTPINCERSSSLFPIFE
mmetsp:Transcript_13817/g.16740  ORF Transcript_13817/g.16740 Transcript_13817/m.16740 type:complete len:212 (+) Transcript_13817:1257-1892(+)